MTRCLMCRKWTWYWRFLCKKCAYKTAKAIIREAHECLSCDD